VFTVLSVMQIRKLVLKCNAAHLVGFHVLSFCAAYIKAKGKVVHVLNLGSLHPVACVRSR
jgi:hypothetical protein